MGTTYFDTREFDDLARWTVGLDVLTMGEIIRWCETQCARRSIPFETIFERRWNSDGEPIGPRMEISHDAAELVLAVAEAMTTARDAAFARVLDTRALT